MDVKQALTELEQLEARSDLNDRRKTLNDATRTLVRAIAESIVGGPLKAAGTTGPRFPDRTPGPDASPKRGAVDFG